MEVKLTFTVNEYIYLKDPESTVLGQQIINQAIAIIYEIGFENFTIKKLAINIGSTEATIYRYFASKHKLLLYIINWYWSYMVYLIDYNTQNLTDNKTKLLTIIKLLTSKNTNTPITINYNLNYLYQIIIAESSKVYLVKDVNEINKNEVFKSYKDLCRYIANIISAYDSSYKYPKTLSSTIIETSHFQQFFSEHLPRLTDVPKKTTPNFVASFIEDMVFKILK